MVGSAAIKDIPTIDEDTGAIPNGYKQTEVGLVPEDWKYKGLNDTASLKARIGWQGLTTAEYLDNGKYFLVTGTEFKNGTIDWNNCWFVEKLRYDQDKNIQVNNDDILITKDGTIGKIAYVNNVPLPATLNSGVFVIRPIKDAFLPKYFYYVLNSNIFGSFLNKLSAGSTINHLYQKDFVKFCYPLPPTKKEQEAIASALSDTDDWIASLETLIAKKQALKEGAMQELLSGKRRLEGFEGKWEDKKLGKLATIQRGASPRPIDDPIWFEQNSNIGWVRISDVTKSGMYLYETQQKLSEKGVSKSRPVEKNNLIMSICATVGRPVITKIDVCIHDGFVVFQNLEAEKKYLYYFLQYIERNWSKHGQTGSQMNLNTGLINSTKISIPKDRQEQKAIASILSDMDNEISQLEQKLEKAKQIKQGVMQALLTGRIRLV